MSSLARGSRRPPGVLPEAPGSPLGARVCSAGSPRQRRPCAQQDHSPDLPRETGPQRWFLAEEQWFGNRSSPLCWTGPAGAHRCCPNRGRHGAQSAGICPFTRWGSSSSSWPTQSPRG